MQTNSYGYATHDPRSVGAAMARLPMPLQPSRSMRSIVLASSDTPLRQTLARELHLLRWTVREAQGAAEIFSLLEEEPAAVAMVDTWLPDLDAAECLQDLRLQFPEMDLLCMDGSTAMPGEVAGRKAGHPFRGELLHAARQAARAADFQATDAHEAEVNEPVQARAGLPSTECSAK